jgi:signal transduction histidine kinase
MYERRQGAMVLLVDDSPTQARHAAMILEDAGFRVELATNGKSGLEKAREARPDIILSDVLMPIMDGFALCREIRRDPLLSSIPVVLQTSTFVDAKDAEFAHALGASRYILKTTDADALVGHLCELLEQHTAGVAGPQGDTADAEAFVQGYGERFANTLEQKIAELEEANKRLVEHVAETTAARDQLAMLLRERERAEADTRLLAEASSVLASSLDYVDTLGRLARLTVPHLADWCAVDMVEADGTIKRVASVQHDGSTAEWPGEFQELTTDHSIFLAHVREVLRDGKSMFLPAITGERLRELAHGSEPLAAPRDVMASLMIIPLIARGSTLGTISCMVTQASKRQYQLRDLQLAENLAGRAAIAVDNARLYEDAQEAIRLQDEFLSIAAHELRTPVTAMMGYIQLLQARVAGDWEQRALGTVSEQTERLARLVEVLLDLSHIDAGTFSLQREPLDLVTLTRRVIERTRAAMHPHGPRHTSELVCDESSLVVDGDEARLEQVVDSLLNNAIAYSPAGGRILVRLERRDQDAVLAVTDQGMGIPMSARPRLFQRFYRAPNGVAQHSSGFGIGLYIAHKIVQMHGGTIRIEDDPWPGTTFTFSLPLHV